MLTTLFTVQELQDNLQLPSRIARIYSVHGAAAAWSTYTAASVRCWQGECCCEGSGWTGLVLEQAICVCTPPSPLKVKWQFRLHACHSYHRKDGAVATALPSPS